MTKLPTMFYKCYQNDNLLVYRNWSIQVLNCSNLTKQKSNKKPKLTFKVIVPRKPALTVTGSFNAFSASDFSFKSLRTTSPKKMWENMLNINLCVLNLKPTLQILLSKLKPQLKRNKIASYQNLQCQRNLNDKHGKAYWLPKKYLSKHLFSRPLMTTHGHTHPSISEANARPIRKVNKNDINQNGLENYIKNSPKRIEIRKCSGYTKKISLITWKLDYDNSTITQMILRPRKCRPQIR